MIADRRVVHWEDDEPLLDTAQHSVSTTSRRRRRLRPLPWSWDSDSDLDGPVQSQVRRSQRSCPVVLRTDAELPATVPASPGALFAAVFLSEHELPTCDTQHNRMLVFRRRTVGEPETTVPATPLGLAAAGMAVDVPATVLDALEEDLESTVAANSKS